MYAYYHYYGYLTYLTKVVANTTLLRENSRTVNIREKLQKTCKKPPDLVLFKYFSNQLHLQRFVGFIQGEIMTNYWKQTVYCYYVTAFNFWTTLSLSFLLFLLVHIILYDWIFYFVLRSFLCFLLRRVAVCFWVLRNFVRMCVFVGSIIKKII